MGSGMPMDGIMLIGVVLEAILYGFSLLMFIATIWVLLRKDGRCSANPTAMALIAVFLLVLSTVHFVINIVRIYESFIHYRNTFPGGPAGFLADVSQWGYVADNAVYTLHTLVGDGMVIYRCYVVWPQSRWIIILPCLLWCSVVVTGVGAVYSVSQATVNAKNVFAKVTSQWITAFLAATFSANLLSSALLAYRIWSIESAKRTSRVTLKPAMFAFIDAAILYSVFLVVSLALFITANNGENIVLLIVVPIISIAFYMVLIRIGLWRDSDNCTLTTTGGVATQDLLRELQACTQQLPTTNAISASDLESGSQEGPLA